MSDQNQQLAPAAKAPQYDLALLDPQTRIDIVRFDHTQRVAKMFASSQLVPKAFQGNLQNCAIAIDLADRIGANRLAVLQSLNIIHGKPSWSSQFIISAVNACGRFHPLRFEFSGTGDERGCVCWTMEKDIPLSKRTLKEAQEAGLPVIESVRVTLAMAKAEGWYQKDGSKWKTMPDLMMQYRCATFFGRIHAPELLNGMATQEEVIDVGEVTEATPAAAPAPEPEPTVKRGSKRSKGLSEMKAAEPVPTENENPATPPPAEPQGAEDMTGKEDPKPLSPERSNGSEEQAVTSAASAPASAAEKQAEPPSPAPSEPTAPAPGETPFDLPPRCEIKKVEDKGKGVFGVTLEGDFTGIAYYQWAEGRPKVPDAGTMIDAKLSDKPSKVNPARTLKCLDSFEVVA